MTTDKAPVTVEQGDYEPDEIEFMQTLLDRYSEDGGMIRLVADHAAFMKIVRQYRLQSTAALEEEIKRLRLDLAAQECLQDSTYKAGVKHGWNLCVADDEDGYQRIANGTEHIAELKRIREARTALEGRGS